MANDYEKFLWGEAESEDLTQRARAFYYLAEYSVSAHDFHRALALNESANATYKEAGDQEGIAESRVQFARILAHLGSHDEAIKELEDCSLEARADVHEGRLARLVAIEAGVYQAKEQFDRAEECFKSSIELFKNDGSNEDVIQITGQYVKMLQHQRRFAEGLAAIESIEKNIVQVDDARSVADLTLRKGRILTELGRHSEALETLDAALESFKFLRMPARVHAVQLATARAYNQARLWGKALEICAQVEPEIVGHSANFGRAAKMRLKFMFEKAYAHYSLAQFFDSRAVASQAAKVAATLGYGKVQVRCLRILAAISLEEGNLDSGEAFFRQALAANAKLEKPAQCRKAKLRLATILVDKGADQEVIDLLESFDVYEWPHGDFENRQLYFGCLMLAYLQLGNLEQANTLAKLVLDNSIVEGAVSQSAMMAHDTLADVEEKWGNLTAARTHGLKALAMAIELEHQPVAQRLSKRWLG